jgi:multidrug efflux pump subunit AcrA (membrane-fusion protein)
VASGIAEPSSPDKDEEEKGQNERPGVASKHSRLVQRLLTATANLPAFINDLLSTQAIVVAGTEAAGFKVERGAQGPSLRPVAHIRPDESNDEIRAAAMSAFQELVSACVTQTKDGAIEINAGDNAAHPQFCLVTLLREEGQIVAATAVITRCTNMQRAQQRLISMQLVAGYFELFTLKRNSEQAQIMAQSHQHVFQFAAAVAAAPGFESASMALCNEMAARTGASRISLGWIKRDYVRLVALSHTEQFDKKQELVVELEKVMEECLDQEEPVHFVPGGGGTANVSRAAGTFSQSHGGNAVLSLPLRRQSEVVGVVVLEFAPSQKVSEQAMTALSVSADLLAPQLFDRHANDRWLITKTGIAIKELTEKATGPRFMLAKVLMVTVALLLIFICCFHVTYHVSAPFEFQPVAKNTISCPVDGYIETVDTRPGDWVKKGQPLLKLKTDELEHRLNEAVYNAEKADADASEARKEAETDFSKAGDYTVHYYEALSYRAEAALYRLQIDESTIRAPSDGQVLTGDLWDQVNTFKKQGDELFTFQGGSELRAELSVAENDIQEVVKFGHDGKLATSALPRDRFPFTIERIDPEGEAKEGSNIFKVIVALPESKDHPEWRPGMQGEANINIQQRTIAWIWTHKFIDWLRLKAWTWL